MNNRIIYGIVALVAFLGIVGGYYYYSTNNSDADNNGGTNESSENGDSDSSGDNSDNGSASEDGTDSTSGSSGSDSDDFEGDDMLDIPDEATDEEFEQFKKDFESKYSLELDGDTICKNVKADEFRNDVDIVMGSPSRFGENNHEFVLYMLDLEMYCSEEVLDELEREQLESYNVSFE